MPAGLTYKKEGNQKSEFNKIWILVKKKALSTKKIYQKSEL